MNESERQERSSRAHKVLSLAIRITELESIQSPISKEISPKEKRQMVQELVQELREAIDDYDNILIDEED